MSKFTLKYGSVEHIILSFARMNNGTLTIPYLSFMNPKRFPKARAGNTKQVLMKLERYGLVTRELGEFDTWTLEPLGYDMIKLVRRYPIELRELSDV